MYFDSILIYVEEFPRAVYGFHRDIISVHNLYVEILRPIFGQIRDFRKGVAIRAEGLRLTLLRLVNRQTLDFPHQSVFQPRAEHKLAEVLSHSARFVDRKRCRVRTRIRILTRVARIRNEFFQALGQIDKMHRIFYGRAVYDTVYKRRVVVPLHLGKVGGERLDLPLELDIFGYVVVIGVGYRKLYFDKISSRVAPREVCFRIGGISYVQPVDILAHKRQRMHNAFRIRIRVVCPSIGFGIFRVAV